MSKVTVILDSACEHSKVVKRALETNGFVVMHDSSLDHPDFEPANKEIELTLFDLHETVELAHALVREAQAFAGEPRTRGKGSKLKPWEHGRRNKSNRRNLK